jgi:hypothetical protein
MNFQAVEAANGNRVTMYGTFVEVGAASYTANQKAKAVCKVRDTNGVTHNVHVYQGKGFLPGPQNINQRYEFSLNTFQDSYQGNPYTGYSGFWNSNTQGAQQQTPQAPPQQPQQPKSKKDVDWDAISRGKVRCKVVCAFIQKYGGRNQEIPIGIIDYWVDYIMTGQGPASIPGPDPSIQGPPTGDDIPF